MIENFEEILKENKEEICDLAIANVSDDCDGVVYIDINTGKLFGVVDNLLLLNPLQSNKSLEVYRLEKGFVCEECAGCVYCDWFEDCDSHEGSERTLDCAVNNLMEEFDNEFDDILGGVYTQIQEWGYDLI